MDERCYRRHTLAQTRRNAHKKTHTHTLKGAHRARENEKQTNGECTQLCQHCILSPPVVVRLTRPTTPSLTVILYHIKYVEGDRHIKKKEAIRGKNILYTSYCCLPIAQIHIVWASRQICRKKLPIFSSSLNSRLETHLG